VRTQRPHFEELDWLDYAQDVVKPIERAKLEEHLTGCGDCQDRLLGLRRIAKALPALEELLGEAGGENSDSALVARAARLAGDTNEAILRAREAFSEPLLAPSEISGLSEAHVIAALQDARELFTSRFERARILIDWAASAVTVLRQRAPLKWPGLEGSVRSYLAYLRFRDGATTDALEELAAARPFLDLTMPLRDLELAFWSYVRAACLHNLSRFPEALAEIGAAEAIYREFGDAQRLARSRLLRALLLCDAGFPEQGLPIHEALLADPNAAADQRIYAILYLNYSANLVSLGSLASAKAAYAKTTRLLRDTGQEDQLYKVRGGLADIAYREGRIADALALNLELRTVYKSRNIPWDEVRRELWIIRALLDLSRLAEAKDACRSLALRATELSLRDEACRALSYLADTEQAIDAEAVAAVQNDLQSILRGESTRWSAA
jgi:hypothetical protein